VLSVRFNADAANDPSQASTFPLRAQGVVQCYLTPGCRGWQTCNGAAGHPVRLATVPAAPSNRRFTAAADPPGSAHYVSVYGGLEFSTLAALHRHELKSVNGALLHAAGSLTPLGLLTE